MLNAKIQHLPIVVLYPHSRCNCRCVMCDIWKETSRAEITSSELERHVADFKRLSVEWVVLSGGEPLMHSDLFRLCAVLKKEQIRITLLSTGLLLARHAESIVRSLDEVIVSLDGPPDVHDRIRRIPGAFSALAGGVKAIHSIEPSFPISARSTVQLGNYSYLRETAQAAKQLGLKSISFLAADVTSEAFNHPQAWTSAQLARVVLEEQDIPGLQREIDALVAEWSESGFVVETPEKLQRIVRHFRARLNLCAPVAPRCNAPWVSAVIEADGTVRPCFFHKPIGRLTGKNLLEVLNGFEAQQFRLNLDVERNPVCQRCVCSLNWMPPPVTKLLHKVDDPSGMFVLPSG
jgi:MoaA/NifB/PqqE/SkfB family radical SAM enzyme